MADEDEELRKRYSLAAAAGRNIDPAFQPGAIAAATAPQPLQTATQPGQAALDVVPHGTPLMSVKGVVEPWSGRTFYQPLQQSKTFNDMASTAIEAKQNFLNARQASIMREIQGASPKRASALLDELGGIEADTRISNEQRHNLVMEDARNAEVNLKLDKSILSAKQYTGLAQRLASIKDAPGTPRHEQAVYKAMADFPFGAMTASGRKAIGDEFGRQPPTKEAIQAAIGAVPEGYRASEVVTTKGGDVNIHLKPTVDAEKELKPYGLSVEQIRTPLMARIGTYEKDRGGKLKVDKKGNPQFKPDSSGEMVRISTGTKKGNVDLPIDVYRKYGGKLSAEDEKKHPAVNPVEVPAQSKSRGTVKRLGIYNPETGNFDVEEEEEEE